MKSHIKKIYEEGKGGKAGLVQFHYLDWTTACTWGFHENMLYTGNF